VGPLPWLKVRLPEGTAGVPTVGVTVVVIILEVTGLAQCIELVIWQLTCCPFVRLLVLKPEEVAPLTAAPLMYH